MLKKFFAFNFALMFVFGVALTASAASLKNDSVKVEFNTKSNKKSPNVTVYNDARLIGSIFNKNEGTQVRYTIKNALTSQIIAKGLVEPGEKRSFNIQVAAGTYYIKGKPLDVDDATEGASATLLVQ